MLKSLTRFGTVSNPASQHSLLGAILGIYVGMHTPLCAALHVYICTVCTVCTRLTSAICTYVCTMQFNQCIPLLLQLLATKSVCHGEPPLWAHVAYTMPVGRHIGRDKLEDMVSQSHPHVTTAVVRLLCVGD